MAQIANCAADPRSCARPVQLRIDEYFLRRWVLSIAYLALHRKKRRLRASCVQAACKLRTSSGLES